MANKLACILLIAIAAGLIMFAGCGEPEESETETREEAEIKKYNQFCGSDSACASVTSINPGCVHYCEGDECTDDMPVCKAYNNKVRDSRVCKISVPCKKPSRIECIDGVCVTS